MMTLKEFWGWFNEDANYNCFFELYDRWQDEWMYEDIKDYEDSLNNYYGHQGVTFSDGTDDFHFKVTAYDLSGELYINEEKDVLTLKIFK